MTRSTRVEFNPPDGGPSDAMARLLADDRAIDAMAGHPGGDLADGAGPSDDPVIGMLAAWRDDVADGADTALPPLRPGARPAVADLAERRNGAAGPGRTGRPGTGSDRPDRPGRPERRPGRSRRRRRAGRLVLAAGVAALATTSCAGVAVAAGNARPGSPLWPVTKAIYPERAASVEHEDAARKDLDDARRAAGEGRVGDAQRYLDDASKHSRQVHPDSEGARLRGQADQLRSQIGGPSPSDSSVPRTGPVATPTPSGGSAKPPSGSGKPSPSKPGPSTGSHQPSSPGSPPGSVYGTQGGAPAPSTAPPSPDHKGHAKGH